MKRSQSPKLFSPQERDLSEIDMNERSMEVIALLKQAGFALPLELAILKDPKLYEEKTFQAAIRFIRKRLISEDPDFSRAPLSKAEEKQKEMHQNNLAELYASYRVKHQRNNQDDSEGCCSIS